MSDSEIAGESEEGNEREGAKARRAGESKGSKAEVENFL